MIFLVCICATLFILGFVIVGFSRRRRASARAGHELVEGGFSLERDADPSAPKLSTIGLIYVDAAGEKTSRIVTIREMRVADGPGAHSTIAAFCHLRQEMRTFRLDRIESFFDPETGEMMRRATLATHEGELPVIAGTPLLDVERKLTFENLSGVADHFGDRLRGLGWIVERRDLDDGELLGCFRLKKRGEGHLKYPTVAIYFEPRSIEARALPDGGIEQVDIGPRRRPWSVRAHTKYIGSWGTLERALPTFLREAGLEGDDCS